MRHVLLKALGMAAFIMLAFSLPAAASELKSGQIQSFIASMVDVQDFAAKLKAEGKDDLLEPDLDIENQFTPYAAGVATLKQKAAGDYQSFGTLVKKHDFASQESWAETGDRVMLSFIALEAEENNPDMMDMPTELPPEMMAQMPPETQEQMKLAIAMVKQIRAAPEADKQAVKPFVGAIRDLASGQGQEPAQ